MKNSKKQQGKKVKDTHNVSQAVMKKIIIFTSTGGRGHLAASNALQQYLGQDYQLESVCIFSEVLKSFDPIHFITGGHYGGEDFYNKLLCGKWFRIINVYVWFGCFYFRLMRKYLARRFENYLKDKNPDLIISVTPCINGALLDAAKRLDLPFIVIPTDLDSTTFVQDITVGSYDKFRYCIAFNDSNIKKTIESADIPAQYIVTTGFPIRRDFFELKDHEAIRKKYTITAGKPVVLLMLGGLGSKDLIPFVKELSTMSTAAHLIVCTGKNRQVAQQLNNIVLPKNITMTIVEFTDRISDLMAVTDLLITKSGSVTVCEGIYLNIPLLLDATTKPLAWEELNHHLTNKYHLGAIINQLHKLPYLVTTFLENKDRLKEARMNLRKFDKKEAGIEIAQLIKTII